MLATNAPQAREDDALHRVYQYLYRLAVEAEAAQRRAADGDGPAIAEARPAQERVAEEQP